MCPRVVKNSNQPSTDLVVLAPNKEGWNTAKYGRAKPEWRALPRAVHYIHQCCSTHLGHSYYTLGILCGWWMLRSLFLMQAVATGQQPRLFHFVFLRGDTKLKYLKGGICLLSHTLDLMALASLLVAVFLKTKQVEID